ncbi:MAG TPA: outer membrane lipoprotein carrier protein LolA [Bacteroidales bacterium]|nr:outer membrane lipoprotein carrier protein LolA [Bacteroidales bacterium]
MRRTFLSLLFLSFSFALMAQTDVQALKILDQFSAKATKAPSVFMEFNLVTINQAEGTTDSMEGSVLISKDKYKLELPDNVTFFNGESTWSYLPAEKEVTITKAEKGDDSFMSKPSTIFTLYKKGYKCRLIDETPDLYVIDLYPEELKTEIIRIRTTISKVQMEPVNFEYKRKDGIVITLNIISYDLKQQPKPDSFVFQEAKYPGVEVIDMR